MLARRDGAWALGRDATLWGCRLGLRADEIRIVREPKAVEGHDGATEALWDSRWRLTGPHESGLRVRALGPDGLRQCRDWRATGHSRAALVVSPAIWADDRLISAPLAGFGAGWTAEIVTDFPSCVLSH
jgi:tRNA(Ile)-lysidine synthase